MPNYIKNDLRVYSNDAETIDALLAATTGPESAFDFDTIKPMPEELHITSGSAIHDAAAMLDYKAAEKMLAYSWVREAGIQTVDALRDLLRKQYRPIDGCATLDAFAERVKSNVFKYGAASWYEWAREHWGTKWNASGVEVEHTAGHRELVRIQFQTAWSPPYPIIDELARRFPALSFRLTWTDEGDGHEQQHHASWEDGVREQLR